MTDKIPLDDIQGIILDDYFDMRLNYYLLCRIVAPQQTRTWLRTSVAPVESPALTSAKKAREYHAAKPEERDPEQQFWNIAFTVHGLKALEVDPALLDSFPFAFVEGSDTPARARILGDVGDSAPENWIWGSRKNPVHVLLMVYLPDRPDPSDKEKWQQLRQRGEALRKRLKDDAGLEVLHRESGGPAGGYDGGYGGRGKEDDEDEEIDPLMKRLLADNKEHFGFRDSISQPIPYGINPEDDDRELDNFDDPHRKDLLQPGEFLLGYKNQYSDDKAGTVIKSHVPIAADGSVLGQNCSYLVFRQLEQDGPTGAGTLQTTAVEPQRRRTDARGPDEEETGWGRAEPGRPRRSGCRPSARRGSESE